jgi:hypothetical protein
VAELDCVESFGFLNEANEYVSATLVETVKWPKDVTVLGNNVEKIFTKWAARVDGIDREATLDVPLQSPMNRLGKKPDGSFYIGAALRPWVESEDLLDIKVRFVIRTSFLRPQNIQLVAEEADFTHKVIRGGNSWMFEGKGTPISNYSEGRKTEQAKDSSTLHFIIHHADANLAHGYWPAKCASNGYSVQAFNSNMAGEPYWDSNTNSLNFAIYAPHLMSTGAANVGFFKLWTTDTYMNCQWPRNTMAKSNNLTVQVINEDGTKQVATSRVVHANGKLFVEATGFHYSSPTIKIVDSSRPAKAIKRTITCVKKTNSKVIKKVTATAPKCPTGYTVKK